MRYVRRVVLLSFGALIWLGCGEDPDPSEPIAEPPKASPTGMEEIAFVRSGDSSPKIQLANADGTGVVELTEGYVPAWSWDGGRIAFNRGNGLYVINADGSGERLVASHARGPSWSPGDSLLAYEYCSAGPGGGECYDMSNDLAIRGIGIVNADGLGSRLLIPEGCCTIPDYPVRSLAEITWSPDGQSVAFIAVSQEEGFWGAQEAYLWVASVDGSKQFLAEIRGRLTCCGDPSNLSSGVRSPVWSPDGSRIAFTTHDVTLDSGWHSVVASIPSDGRGEWQVHYRCEVAECLLLDVDWSPDGKLIAFDRDDGKGFRTYVLDVGTGEARQIIEDVPGAGAAYAYRDWGVVWSRR